MNNNPFFEIFDTGSMRVAFVGVLAILALFLLAETITITKNSARPSTPATDVITVQGNGQAALPPDVARVSFTVQNTATTVADAQAATTKQVDAALDFVKGQGVAEKDIKTLSYNISPQYAYPNPCPQGAHCPAYSGAPKIIGYQVSESIQVTIRNLPLVGALLGGLGTLEIQNVNGPDFVLDDATAGYNAARADAINKAKEQAGLLEKQLGVSLGKIVNFSESSGSVVYPMMFAEGVSLSKAASTPEVPVGENTYTASVSITYEIR
jgi:uncharacterized protein